MRQPSAIQLSIQSLGMVSPVGLNVASSCAAIRARIARFEEIPFHDEAGQPIVASPALEGAEGLQGYRRMIPMLCRAIDECISGRPEPESRIRSSKLVPLFVAVDSLNRPDYPKDLPARIFEKVRKSVAFAIPDSSRVLTDGKTGFFRALELARQVLRSGDAEACIVAATDSLLNARALAWLEKQERLKTDLNSDGVIPSEAAAAIWVTRSRAEGHSKLDIVGIGFGDETSVLQEDAPNLGTGLSQAMNAALQDAQIPLSEVDFRVGGMTGERADFREAALALARIQRTHKDNFELWLPAEKLGDVGAALPACMLVVTAIGITKGYAPGQSALIFTTSDTSSRAACVAAGGSYVE